MINSTFKTYFAVDINSTSFDVWFCVRLCKGTTKSARRGPRAEAFVSELYKFVTISCMTLGQHWHKLGQHWDNTGAILGWHWDNDGMTPRQQRWDDKSLKLVQHWDDTRMTLGWHWDNTGTTLGQHLEDIGTTLGWHWHNTGMTREQHLLTILGPHWDETGTKQGQ